MPRIPKQDPLIDEDYFEEGDEPSDDEGEDSLSETDLLLRYMAAMSFKPQKALHDAYLEFFKTYTDPSGRSARALAVVKKDATGLKPDRPEYFTITVQVHIPATLEDVEKKAPAFVRPDLLRILGAFDEIGKRKEAFKFDCESCNLPTHEYTLIDGKRVCGVCLLKNL